MYSGIKSSRNGYASITYPMTDKNIRQKKESELSGVVEGSLIPAV